MIEKHLFGNIPGKGDAFIYTLANKNGITVRITNYGGTVVSLYAPDREGNMQDIVLGYDTLDGYIADSSYLGATIGRVGNRIGGGRFSLNGNDFQLALNDNGKNCLHGGKSGFNKALWETKEEINNGTHLLRMSYSSHDGEEGFPGNLKIELVYSLTEDNSLRIDYFAETDRVTPVNLTNHSYFNLSGAGSGSVEKHIARFFSDSITPVNTDLIPTGEILPVDGTAFDFSEFREIGSRINDDNEQISAGNGYDHNFIVKGYNSELKLVAEIRDTESGRSLDVFTTYPGFQFYTGNFLDGSIAGKKGLKYCKRGAFCIEPQYFPDSVNHSGFPSSILKPGKKYSHTIIYRPGNC